MARTRKVGVVACNFDELKCKCKLNYNKKNEICYHNYADLYSWISIYENYFINECAALHILGEFL
jgi:hypothetical protein